MSDDATILAKFAVAGDEEFIAMFQKASQSMKATESAAQELQKRLDTMLDAGTIKAREHLEMSQQIPTVVRNIAAAEKERTKVLVDQDKAIEKINADMSKEEAQMAKIIQRTQELNATALGRFNASVYGGVAALDKMEASAYQASRNATLMVQSFVKAPIATMKQFAASTEKAAIASQFLKEQLSFVLASRFGTIAMGFAVFGTATKMIHDTASAAMDLEKQIRFVESAFLGAERTLRTYSNIQNEMLLGSVRFGQSYQDIAKILWELKSAGLPAADAMAGLQANQALVVAGAGDIAQSTRLTAGLFRTYGNEIKGATSSQEKFARIAELLATVVYESQGDMNDMVNALKYTVSTADVAGIKLDELAALIAVMNDKMLFGSKAGTSLNNSFLELAKNLDDVVGHFGLVVDKSKPLGDQLLPIIGQMQDRFKGTNLTMEEMSQLFDDFNIRGGRAWAAIITSGERLWEILDKTNAALEGTSNNLEALVKIRLDNTTDQLERLKNAAKAAAIQFADLVPFKNAAKWVSDADEIWLSIQKMTEAAGLFDVALRNWALKGDLGRIFAGDMQQALDVLKNFPEEIKTWYKIPGLVEATQNAEHMSQILEGLRRQPIDVETRPLIQKMVDALKGTKELEQALANASNITLNLDSKPLVEQLYQITGDAEMAVELFKKFPNEVAILFNTPGMSDSIKNSQQLLDIVSTLNGLTPTLRFDLQLGNVQEQMNNVLFLQKAINLSRQDEISFTKLWSNYQTERAQKDKDELNALKKEAVELGGIIKLSDDKRKRVEQLVNEYEKQNKELDKSAKSAQKLADIFDSIKEIQIAGEAKSLVAEIKTLNDKLLNAVDRTLTIKGGTESWKQSVVDVAKAYQDSLKAQDMLNKQLDEAIKAYQQLQSAGAGFVDTLKRVGREGEARMISELVAQQAEQALEIAQNDQQRLQALQGIISAYRDLEQSGYNQSFALDRQLQAYNEMFAVNQQLVEQERSRIGEMQKATIPLEITRQKAEEIFQKTGQWKQPVEEFNQSLQNSQQQLQTFDVYLGGIKQKLQFPKDSLNFQGSLQQVQQLNQKLQTMDVILGGIAQKVQLPTDSFDEIEVYMGGILQKVKIASTESGQWAQELNQTTNEASNISEIYKDWTEGLSDSLKIVGSIANTGKPLIEFTSDVLRNLDWNSPLLDSFYNLESIKDSVGNVKFQLLGVISTLDSMASKIRSMPKLDIGTGGGGGGISSNELLTNPDYQ